MQYILTLLFCGIFTIVNAQQTLFNTLEKNVKSYYLMSDDNYKQLNEIIKNLDLDPKAVDQVTIEVYQKKKSDSVMVNSALRLLNSDGSWSDINYKDDKLSGWAPKIHTDRILALTLLYSNPESEYYQNAEIKAVLHKAMDFWFKAKLVCRNWWYNEIGIPKTLGPAFIFLKYELSPEEMQQAIVVLNKSGFKQTGQNKVWQAGNVLFKSILLEDEQLAKRARDTIFSELRITTDEGIQPDFSFHQHGPQQQFGNYGLSFVTSMSFWARVLSGTTLKLPEERLNVIRNLILEGFSWVNWKGTMDINALGRQFFKGAQKSKSLALAYAVIDMIFIDEKFADSYKAYISSNYALNKKPITLGTKHFWRSDMTIHRSPKWSSSVKMSSDRVQATEALNRENLKGYHVGDGTMFLYLDGKEYFDIFPLWNWKKLPGVTNYQKPGPLPILTISGYHNKGDFTGGITSGNNGMTAFKLNRDSLTANKAWFYYNDKLICLGAAIDAQLPDSVFTTINQTYTNGDVLAFNKQINTIKKGETQTSSSFKWIYHNQIGYYPLASSVIKINNQPQIGSWGEIAFVYDKEKPLKKDILTLEIQHGKQPKNGNYAYAVLPGLTAKEMESFKPDFDVLQNNKAVQAIINKDKSVAMFAVYQPTSVKISGFKTLNFKQAALYILEKSKNGWMLYVADPTQKLKNVNLSWGTTNYNVDLPQGDEKGKTISLKLAQL
ncbi:chondroitinase-AC [Pedobacter glucosidilyticus]|nr:polysaccharide lyase family 8 super-sandwich domain-containing protein [Pedobacter glucosidilyticus]KHJ38721.1 chondroitinase-AC [Pedobacter glucosidilyticus]